MSDATNEPVATTQGGGGRRWLVPVIVAAVLGVLLLAVLVLASPAMMTQAVGSMAPTIGPGDSLFVESLTYRFRDPRPGEIVAFESPIPAEGADASIKRVVAIGGQTVAFESGKLVVDGVAVDEPYTGGSPSEALEGSGVSYPVQVPEGSVWLMGDNRAQSADSRVFGPIEISAIRGRVANVK